MLYGTYKDQTITSLCQLLGPVHCAVTVARDIDHRLSPASGMAGMSGDGHCVIAVPTKQHIIVAFYDRSRCRRLVA